MPMRLTKEMVEEIISDSLRRCKAAKAIGLPLYKAMDGEPIPDGWELDYETLYYLPPNVKLL